MRASNPPAICIASAVTTPSSPKARNKLVAYYAVDLTFSNTLLLHSTIDSLQQVSIFLAYAYHYGTFCTTKLAPREGLEPSTHAFSGHRSTD